MKQKKKSSKDDAGKSQSDNERGDPRYDPRYDLRYASSPTGTFSRGKIDRKAAQLCAQIRRALDYVIPEVLSETKFDAIVLDVEPAPNTSHLLVILQAIGQLDASEIRELDFEIAQRAGSIRTAVAQSIYRRKTPTLSFRIVPS
jgi:ribosome-binding factor A